MRTFLLLLLLPAFISLKATNTTACLIDSIPSITCPPSITLSTGIFTCTANHTYSVIANDDLPGWLLVQTTGLPSGSEFPLGATANVYVVTDVENNTASCAFTVTVKDYTPPVAVCNVATSVSLGVDDPSDCYGPMGFNGVPPALDACTFGGITWVKAAAFDDGSNDNCGNIRLTIRRMPPYSNKILGLNQINGHPTCNDPFPDFPNEFEQAISELDSIKFYGFEAGTTQNILLTVYQVDADGNITLGPDGALIYNQCFIGVTVEDNIKPQCTAPAQVAVSCEMFDPTLAAYGNATVLDNCCLDTSKVYLGQCGLTQSVNYALFDTICNRGTITRIFRAFDCTGNSSSCTQRVVVNYMQNYFIKFPDDTLVSACNATGVYGKPIIFGEDCELMDVSYEDEIFGVFWPDACFRIERNWAVINWCTYNPNLPRTYVPNPTLVLTSYHHPLNAPGPIVSACGTLAPWAPTLSKITPLDTLETNYCSLWNANANGYQYKQFIKILDTIPPTFVHCPPGATTYLDPTENHPFYWNNVFNPNLPAQNLAERKVDLSIEASDACYGGNIYIRYHLFLDLDGDGTMESVVNSMNPPPADTIYYGNLQSPNYIGGTARAFDNRPVAQNQKWRFTIQVSLGANTKNAFLRWNTGASPNTYVLPELPVGTHKIKWFVQDGCGSESVCEQLFTVKASPLECIPPADVVVSCEQFDPSLAAYGAPTFSGGCMVQDLNSSANYAQFDTVCSKGTIVRIFNAVDDCSNTSQCSQRVVVNHTQHYFIKFPDDVYASFCDGTGTYGEPILFGQGCELLGFNYTDQTIDPVPTACYIIERDWTVINWCTYNPNQNITYVPNPTPNVFPNNPANWPGPTVSACGTAPPWTSTAIKISPTDPNSTDFCTFWSADANGYKYTQHIRITDAEAPIFLECYTDTLYLNDVTQNDPALWNNVFNPNLPTQDLRESPVDLNVALTDDCSGADVNIEYLLFLDLDADGQQETVVNSVHMGSAGLGWNNVQYNNINTPNYSGGTPTSFDNRSVSTDQKWGFALKESVFGSIKTASVRWNTQQSPNTYNLSELPNGRHKIQWFATDGCGNNTVCERIIYIGDTTLVATQNPETDGFALYQNEPNPFNNNTIIRFKLSENTSATLSVFDPEGRLLYRQAADYSAGMHTVQLEQAQLPVSGVLFYKLEAGKHLAWRKMIRIKN